MARIILDSNVIIYISQKKLELKELPVEYDEILISSISCMEVLGFNFPEEETEKSLIEFIDSFNVIDTNFEIRKKVIEYRKKKKIKLPDAIRNNQRPKKQFIQNFKPIGSFRRLGLDF